MCPGQRLVCEGSSGWVERLHVMLKGHLFLVDGRCVPGKNLENWLRFHQAFPD